MLTDYKLETLSSIGPFTESKSLKDVFSYDYTPEMSDINDTKGLISYKWKWIGKWEVQFVQVIDFVPKRSNDSEGWFYAFNWGMTFSEEKFFSGNVRRRKWERTQQEKSARELIQDLLEREGISPEFLLRVLQTTGSVDHRGNINFDKVLLNIL